MGSITTINLIYKMLVGGGYPNSGSSKIVLSKAGSAAIVWYYHEDNASVGNPVLLYGNNLVV